MNESDFELPARLAAVEAVLADLLASAYLRTRLPIKTAEAERERFRNMLTNNPYPNEPSAPGFSEIASGATADAVDALMQSIEVTVRKRLATKGPQG